MVAGVGGSSFEAELARLVPMAEQVAPISTEELRARVAKAQALMREQGIGALYLDTSTNLAYFT
ncbi:aminopeptidase P family protein, partial [Roseomonas sp. DSM 102946]|nr:aminopeptidase P family protein [Roseomonas sp. DSM 102946]